ncbi:hypothetical protein KDA_33510 [Dictyobacter alpinus]|uniref:Uncharacterized protein n=1 Tax=Dictyobacter alpinus TaxID=2014873 RepID=A0A402B967_9CHLR|nr:hypothetical protein [Dictyobacter alpinus]GCE27867.1 hypothetical protein KDA_33510 [Dictyobacter alpinus]
MAKSIHSTNRELRAYGGHFLVGDYSPARRSPKLPTIPARASAHPAAVVKIHPRYPRGAGMLAQADMTRVPTMPQTRAVWEYETPHYAASSSLSALTLAITDTVASMRPASQSVQFQQETQEEPQVAPQYSIVERLRRHDYAEFDTVPPLITSPLKAWSASPHPLEGVRCWLLHPGRLEFLIWFLGTLLLICFTVIFMLLLLSNLGYLTFH